MASDQTEKLTEQLERLVDTQQDIMYKAKRSRRTGEAAARDKLPSEKFGQRIDNVLRLIDMPGEADLPAVWSAMANATKQAQRANLGYHLDS